MDFSQRTPEPITMKDFNEALDSVKSSNVVDINQYIKWEKEFGSA